MSKKGEVLKVVLPGDVAIQLDSDGTKDAIFIGPGLRRQDRSIYATRSGVLNRSSKNIYYVDSQEKRYIPQEGEFVIGIVTKKKGENYLINIAGSEQAVISQLAFENESRKARKDLKPGDLIFGELLVASKDMEPELVAIDVFNNTVGIAALPEGGIMFHIPLHVARLIANPRNTFLKAVAKKVDFVIVVGFNGRVWLSAKELNDMVAVMNCIMMLEVLSLDKAEKNIQATLTAFSG